MTTVRNLDRKGVLLVVFACVCGASAQAALATCYHVDGQVNVIGAAELDNAVPIDFPSPGEYTLTLTASDFRENSDNPEPQRHVVVHGDSTYGDLRTFTLNGVGDSETLDCANPLKLFFVDAPPWTDNTGSSTVEVTSGGSPVGTYTVDAQANVIGSSVPGNSVYGQSIHPPPWAVGLIDSDFRENSGNPQPQRHVVVLGDSTHGDMRTFTLNALDDWQTVDSMNTLRLFFIDGEPWWDNTGGSTVRIAPAVTVSSQQDSDGYSHTVDTYLDSTEPVSTHGQLSWVEIDGALEKHGLLRFDNIFGPGPDQIPLGSPILGATLTLYAGSSSDPGKMHRMLLDWGEGDVWDGWGNGIQADDSEAVAQPDSDLDPMPGIDYRRIDVTPSLQAWSAGYVNHGWVFLPDSEDGWNFRSSEEAALQQRPRLEVAFAGEDCNSNGVDDVSDITGGTSMDCNTNCIPDECDIAEGTSFDCNSNGVPDECDDPDGDGDSVPDECDECPATPAGAAVDSAGRPLGDIDLDCDTDLDDYALFQQGFTGPADG